MHPTAERIQRTLLAAGYSAQVIEMPETTRTAKEAAQAIGCTVQQIAKSLLFRAKVSGTGVLVIASGINRVNEKWLASFLGETIERANPDFVREQTGFVIGGVPPVGHANKLRTLIDRDLLQYEVIWAAAGTPNAVFKTAPSELQAMTGGTVTPIT
jgi:prolyl-tRNA editing enzyme YbaK/EbsC (Cys-tRNA(Pro) deacylase)